MQKHDWRTFLCLTGVLPFVSLTVPVSAQNPAARTYQPGYWQPISRVNPNSPVTVTLVNQTDSPLKYSFLDERSEKNLAVRASAQLENVSLPVNIAIYDPSPQSVSGEVTGLKYETSVTKNAVRVLILPTETSGLQVLNIAKTGAIYAY